MKLMEMLPTDSDFVTTLTKKLAPPLVTLLSTEPEVIYIYIYNYMVIYSIICLNFNYAFIYFRFNMLLSEILI